MRLEKIGLILVLFLLASLAVARPVSAQRRYAVEAITIDAAVQADGTMEIRETLTYDYRGRYSFAFRDIPRTAGGQINGIGVSEGGQAYQASDSNEPGTFEISRESSSTRVTWYYRAEDERRTFDLTYTLDGGVRRFPDTAELYFKFVGDDWDRPIGTVRATVRFPTRLTPSSLRAWAHGPLNGTVQVTPDGSVGFEVSPLPARQFWEGRVLFPSAAVGDLALSATTPRVTAVLGEEREWAETANALREASQRRLEVEAVLSARREVLARRFFLMALGLVPVGLLAWLLAYRRYGRPHDIHAHAAPGEIPSDHPPALVTYLMSRNIGGSAIVATLLDLAHRGYLEIRETVETRNGFFGEKRQGDYRFDRTATPLDGLALFERDLLEFLLSHGDSPAGFTMSAIKKTASTRTNVFSKWFTTWSKKVKAQGEALAFYEPYAAGALTRNVLIGLTIVVTGIVFCVVSRSPAGVPAILAGVVVVVLTAALNRRTAEGRRLFVAWTAFRSHLKSQSRALGPLLLDSHAWGRYLAVSVILGLHKDLLPKLQPIDERGQHVMPVWYFAAHGDSFGTGVSSLSASVSSMVASVSTSMSSASGVGGGASVGGGGGAGGGGGGAG